MTKIHSGALSLIARVLVTAAAAALSSACGNANSMLVKHDASENDILIGPAVTDNTTPLESAFECSANRIRAGGKAPLRLAVGLVRDYTGKFSESNAGSAITQGGSLMVISALGKLGDAVRVFERFDPQVAELELAYMSKRYLGDESAHAITDNGRTQNVPWKPYLGGSVVNTDYFIVGGITELNYNIYSGGAELLINQIGVKARVFAVNVAADLRIVDTRTLEIVKSVSLQKQVLGYEVGASIFNFFGTTLVDLSAGDKSQEPMQLAVRTTLEAGVLELLGSVTRSDLKGCLVFDPTQLRKDGRPDTGPFIISEKLAEVPLEAPVAASAPDEEGSSTAPSAPPSALSPQAPVRPAPRELDAAQAPDSGPAAAVAKVPASAPAPAETAATPVQAAVALPPSAPPPGDPNYRWAASPRRLGAEASKRPLEPVSAPRTNVLDLPSAVDATQQDGALPQGALQR
jgi:curli biogenesis system outer membrane secretion channel CsgG